MITVITAVVLIITHDFLSCVHVAGTKWYKHRKLLTSCFHFKILKIFVYPIWNQAGILTEQLKKASCDGKEVNIIPFAKLCSLDIICGKYQAQYLIPLYISMCHRVNRSLFYPPLPLSPSFHPLTSFSLLFFLMLSFLSKTDHMGGKRFSEDF